MIKRGLSSLKIMLTEEDLHYIGGIIDGEGCITIDVFKKDGNIGYATYPMIRVTMRTQRRENPGKEVLEVFRDEFSDGQTRVTDYHESETWNLSVKGNPAREALEMLEPYLRVKRWQAKLVLSAPWDKLPSKSAFIEVMEKRDELREDRNTESKYDAEFFKEQFTRSSSALDAEW